MNSRERHEIQMNVAQRREMLIELAKRRDWKYRRAKEHFKRPAFWGTSLAQRQQDHA